MKLIILFILFFINLNCFANTHTAQVTGYAQSFVTNKPIADATITVLETQQQFKTKTNGTFGPIDHPIGKPITLIFAKDGFATTQSATVIVPKKGLHDTYSQFTFQVPSDLAFLFLKKAIGAEENSDACHVTSTVTAWHKTLGDVVQGEAGATIKVIPEVTEKPFYFDIFLSGPFKGRTYPFATGLAQTSADGGIAFFNLPPRDQAYRLIAVKQGVTFSEASFLCRKGAFINISPPHGPMALAQ